jgi:hypothetical protein
VVVAPASDEGWRATGRGRRADGAACRLFQIRSLTKMGSNCSGTRQMGDENVSFCVCVSAFDEFTYVI